MNSVSPSSQQLLEKYNVPVPRYTSYPTVPHWHDGIDKSAWSDVFRTDFAENNSRTGVSMYIHLPFCESLCTYCGCNKKITTNHAVEQPYIAALLREWAWYKERMTEMPVLRELHLGGGTPTFFSPEHLRSLISTILGDMVLAAHCEMSFEGHPNNTSREHLQVLYDLGFRRVSFGVQDNDREVQRIINRIQPVERVAEVTKMAREIGYASVNFDLIYGLPRQTVPSIRKTINEVVAMQPDRVAFYSYAHVPWTSRGQRLFDEHDLPTPEAKLDMYRLGKQMFAEAGYKDVGMDHFALPHDELVVAATEGRLHRSFMGYTCNDPEILIGLGVSAISTTPGAYMQNEKTIHDYYAAVENNDSAVVKGIFRSDTDRVFGKYILDVSCRRKADFRAADNEILNAEVLPKLRKLEADGLVVINDDGIAVTDSGRDFIRNICACFDLYIGNKSTSGQPVYSKAV